MKIGVISDTHLTCCDDRLMHLLHDHFRDVDLILHAGDLVDIRVLDAFTGKDVRGCMRQYGSIVGQEVSS